MKEISYFMSTIEFHTEFCPTIKPTNLFGNREKQGIQKGERTWTEVANALFVASKCYMKNILWKATGSSTSMPEAKLAIS